MTQRSPVVWIFILSGVAGLVDEIVWSRQLVLVFGNTTEAVSAILTAFFGGMAIGNAVGGRVADRVRRPLRMYALLELLLAALVIATPASFRLVTLAYGTAFDSLGAFGGQLTLVRFALALVALGPATILMGATLPTLTRHLARDPSNLAVSFGRLYAANTVGGVLGAGLAGFVLIELLGLSGALGVGAGCSMLAGLLAFVLDRRNTALAEGSPVDVPVPLAVARKVSTSGGSNSMLRTALMFAFVSGLTSLGYQTLWTRLLASGSGNSTYVFSFILVVFLIGLALGAALYDAVRHRLSDPVRVLAACQILVATLAIAGLVGVISRPPSNAGDAGGIGGVFARLAFEAILVVLPPTLVMGFSLPVAAELVNAGRATVGTRTGVLLAVNTFGAILGTFLVPFFVIPAIGSPDGVAILAIGNSGFALLVLFTQRGLSLRAQAVLRIGAVGVIAAVVAALVAPGMIVDPGVARIVENGGSVFASSEDEIASVQAGAAGNGVELWVTGTSMTGLTVDTRLMPVLSLALRPDSRRALIVAFGMGGSFRSGLIAGLDTDAVELVPSVPTMFPWFFDDAAAVMRDPRGRVIVADGRNFVDLTKNRYDIIAVDPPPPYYSSGVSVIASLEFYQAARQRLNQGGVMMEWVPYGRPLDEFRAEVRTYATVFPHVLVVSSPGRHGVFMFGSDDRLAFDSQTLQVVLSRPGVLADISEPSDAPARDITGWVASVQSLVLIGDGDATRFAGPGPLVTDDQPLSEYFLIRGILEPMGPETSPATLAAALR